MNEFESDWTIIGVEHVIADESNLQVLLTCYMKTRRTLDNNFEVKIKSCFEYKRKGYLSPASIGIVGSGAPSKVSMWFSDSTHEVQTIINLPNDIEIDKGSKVEKESDWEQVDEEYVLINDYPYTKLYRLELHVHYFIADIVHPYTETYTYSGDNAIKVMHFPKIAYVSDRSAIGHSVYVTEDDQDSYRIQIYLPENNGFSNVTYSIRVVCNDNTVFGEILEQSYVVGGYRVWFDKNTCLDASPNTATPRGQIIISTTWIAGGNTYSMESPLSSDFRINLWTQGGSPSDLLPTVSKVKLEVYNESPADPEIGNIPLKKTSMVHINVQANVSRGASIDHYNVLVYPDPSHENYSTFDYYSGDITDRILQYSGFNEFEIVVHDSRHNAGIYQETFIVNDVDDFVQPVLSDNSRVYRSDAEGNENESGDYFSFYIDGTIQETIGSVLNSKHSLYRFIDGGEYSSWREITPGQRFTILSSKLYYSTNIQICFRDKSGWEDIRTYNLIKGSPVLNLRSDGKGVSFGKISEKENGIESIWPVFAPAFETTNQNAGRTDFNNQNLIRPNRIYQKSDTFGTSINQNYIYDTIKFDLTEPGVYVIMGSCSLRYNTQHANIHIQIIVDYDDGSSVYALSYPTISRAATSSSSVGGESSVGITSGAMCSGFVKLTSGTAKIKLRVHNETNDKLECYSNLIAFRLDGITDTNI